MGVVAGCLDEEPEPKPEPRIEYLEIQNHRHDEGDVFTVLITEHGETVFEDHVELAAGDPRESVVLYEDPVVEPGDYEVVVEVAEHKASVETKQVVSPEEDCLYLDFYLGSTTLHVEYTTWPCDSDATD
ncbi:hypothetical protein [Natronosalvus vescus]|uniref:hypothetical protein n=1 Tax=Natronosalvus vescus TaxID=2953881 RepID=UPI002090EC5F|nr:hypothetical protein [Natronosalvus vescus]